MKLGKALEDKISALLKNSEYEVSQNVIVKDGRRKYEVDILARKGNKSLIIECKDHKYLSPKEQQIILAQLKKKGNLIAPNTEKIFVIVERGTEVKQVEENAFLIGKERFRDFINNI